MSKPSHFTSDNFREVTWREVREDIHKVNSEFASIVDELEPSDDMTLFKAKYVFGSEILQQGKLFLPDAQGRLVPLIDPRVDTHIQEKLSYNLGSNPMSILLNGAMELYLALEDRTIPFFGLSKPGGIFSIWRMLNPDRSNHPAFLWNMTAGARSIFMLPKISEVAAHRRLKRELGLSVDVPTNLLDHWKVFKEISNHKIFGEPWTLDIVFFSNVWVDKLNDKRWTELRHYLLDMAWKGSEFWRNQFVWNAVLSLFQRKRNIKPNPYLFEVLKQLFGIGAGALPGFAPAIDDTYAPIGRIQNAYVNGGYKLRCYAPVIMQPAKIDMYSCERPVYYSLNLSTSIEFSPKIRKRSSVITDLYQLRSLLFGYIDELINGQLNLRGTPFYDLLGRIKYTFFHSDAEGYADILDSKILYREDKSFRKISAVCANKKLPCNGSFVRGCIRVSGRREGDLVPDD